MNICFSTHKQEDMMFINTLTARVERISNPNTTTMQSTQESMERNDTTSRTPQKNRKRKKHPSKTTRDEDSSITSGIYVVASCLNAPLPPKASPIVMYFTADTSTHAWQCVSSASLSVDPSYGQMTCIEFVSRAMCADLWELIASGAKKSNDSDWIDEGVILMGFRDGSLRASIVYRKENANDITIHTSPLVIVIPSAEGAFVSLQLIPSEDAAFSLLVGCKTNGAIVVISLTCIHHQSIQCESRVISMRVVKFSVSSSNTSLGFVGVYDTGRSFLHRVKFTVDDGWVRDWKDERKLLPIPSSGLSILALTLDHKSNGLDDCMFTMSQCTGNVILFKLHSKACGCAEIDSMHSDSTSPIQARLLHKSDVSITRKHHNTNSANKLSTVESLLQKLKSVKIHTDKQSVVSSSIATTSSNSSKAAIKEIREAIRVSSYIRSNLVGPKSHLAPWRLDNCKKVVINKTPFTKQDLKNWNFTVHAIEPRSSATSQSPCCYRLASGRDRVYTKVLYGGAAQSFSSSDPNEESSNATIIHLPPLKSNTSIFGSLQMRYSDDNRVWHSAKSITDTPLDCNVGAAAKCSSLVHFVSISESQIRDTSK